MYLSRDSFIEEPLTTVLYRIFDLSYSKLKTGIDDERLQRLLHGHEVVSRQERFYLPRRPTPPGGLGPLPPRKRPAGAKAGVGRSRNIELLGVAVVVVGRILVPGLSEKRPQNAGTRRPVRPSNVTPRIGSVFLQPGVSRNYPPGPPRTATTIGVLRLLLIP